jgi:S1-C subfamily serine protease
VKLKAIPVAFDARNDLAVLRVAGLALPSLRIVPPVSGTAVAIIGYPGNGKLTAVAGRLGPTVEVLSEDAYGNGPVPRRITTVRGTVQHGDSGGPTVDATGSVNTTVFAARLGSQGGFGVPSQIVLDVLRRARARRVSTGPCA